MRIQKEFVPIFVLILIAITFTFLSINLPIWHITTSKSAVIYSNTSVNVDYYLSQTIIADFRKGNETTRVLIPLSNLTSSEQDRMALSNFFTISLGITIFGLMVSILSLLSLSVAVVKKKNYKFLGFIIFLAGFSLFVSSLYIATTLPQQVSKLTSIIPITIPREWPTLNSQDIKSFWGYVKVPVSLTFPEWIHKQNFWIWGSSSGWTLLFTASILMIASAISQRHLSKAATLEKTTLTIKHKGFLFSFIGGIMIFVNALTAILLEEPIILSSGFIHPKDLIRDDAPMWWRISFGCPNLFTGVFSPFWITIAIINLTFVIFIFFSPMKSKRYSSFLIIFSFLTLAIGGGFLIGFVLAIIGAAMLYEWPKNPSQTFAGKFIGVLKLDSKTYDEIIRDQRVKYSVLAIVTVNALSGAGIALYSYNVKRILGSSSAVILDVLFFGNVDIGREILSTIIIFAGLGVFKWILLSIIIYVIGSKFMRKEVRNIGSIAFSYAPISLQFFMPILFTSKPFLATVWPLSVLFVTNLWMVIALSIMIKQSMQLQTKESIGVILLAGSIYWIARHFIVQTFQIPYNIEFQINPPELVLFLLSCAILAAVLSGVFSKS